MSIYDNKTTNEDLRVENIFFGSNLIVVFRSTSKYKTYWGFSSYVLYDKKTSNKYL
jgi:hypothetical protein